MKQLLRSKKNSKIGGVCGGLGEYFEIDPTVVRLLFIFLALVSGSGLLIYILLWIFIPSEEREYTESAQTVYREAEEGEARVHDISEAPENNRRFTSPTGLFLGIALIAVGALFLLRNLGFEWFYWLKLRTFWPLLLIGLGAALLLRKKGKER